MQWPAIDAMACGGWFHVTKNRKFPISALTQSTAESTKVASSLNDPVMVPLPSNLLTALECQMKDMVSQYGAINGSFLGPWVVFIIWYS